MTRLASVSLINKMSFKPLGTVGLSATSKTSVAGLSLLYFLTVVGVSRDSFVNSEDLLPAADDPTAFYNMLELVCSEGYNVQEHTVVTEDGYILSIYRIPNGKRRPKVPKKKTHYPTLHYRPHPDFAACINESMFETSEGPPVLLAHGLTGASDNWVLQGSDYDLAFKLADKGYDVWFTNIRGNFYARRHKTLKPSDPVFWDFSFHENGIYDMPSTVDYILKVSEYQKLTYVGHSMGTTMFFVMVATMPEYNDKIKLFVGLTPVAQIRRQHFSASRLVVLNTVVNLARALERIGVREIFLRNFPLIAIAKVLCAKGSALQDLCYDLTFSYLGYHSKLFIRQKLPTYIAHALSGSSVKTYYHFQQLLDAPYFQNYDYGPEENFKRYGQPQPPEYDLRGITIPTALYYSKGDYIADVKDVAVMKTLLPNVIESHEYTTFSHIDFLWAYTARESIYSKILKVIDEFRNQ